MVKKRNASLVFFLAALAAALTISGCNITNPIIDEWWPIEETYDRDYDFTHETYIVSFASDGGEYIDLINKELKRTDPPDQEILRNTKAAVPGLVVKDNHSFNGWWYDKNGTPTLWDFDDPVAAADVKDQRFLYLEAGWDPVGTGYTVKFNLNDPDGSGENWKEDNLTYKPLDEKIADGAFVAEPLHFGLTTSDHYIFNGWYKEAACNNAWVFNSDTAGETADTFGGTDNDNIITLYAKWISLPSTVYTINFISGTTYNPPSQYVANGGSLIAPYVVFRDNYSFGGWYKDADCTDDWDFDTDTVGSDITLYAKWFPKDPVDIFKDLRVVSINYILFAGGGTGFNGEHGDGSSTNLTPAEKKTNETVIKIVEGVLEANPQYRVMVVGHANPVTDEDRANPMNEGLKSLSKARADAIKEVFETGLDTNGDGDGDGGLGMLNDPPYHWKTLTPIIPKYEGGRMALRDPSLSRRVEIIIFEIITETVTP